MTSFADLGLSSTTLDAIRDIGYEDPSPIQEQAVPFLMQGRDVIGQAQTGTGKTAAFGLPMVEFVDPEEKEVQALVLTPTRELCIQVTQALRSYATTKGVEVVAVFGGAPIRTQQAQLKGAQIVVGTVGRVLDLISRHSLVLHSCRYLVLDEADEMLDLGFLEDVEKILGLTPNGRQTALFSATMPPEIRGLADRHLYEPEIVKVKAATLTIDTVEQFFLEVKGPDKNAALARVLKSERPDQAIVFVRTKIRCDQLGRQLKDEGVNARTLHGDMSQGSRDGVMLAFKGGRVPVLIATDVASRGLDISTVTHVINFDVPTSPDVYVHRIGRTGRIGRKGRAITFVEPRQAKELAAIEAHAGMKIAPWLEGASALRPGAVDATPASGQETPVEVEARETPAPAAESERPPRRRRSRAKAAAEPVDVEVGEAVEATVAGAVQAPAASEEPVLGDALAEDLASSPALDESAVEFRSLVVSGGRAVGLNEADVVRAAHAAGLRKDQVRHVRLLERFTLLEVPVSEADRVVEAISGTTVAGHTVRAQLTPA